MPKNTSTIFTLNDLFSFFNVPRFGLGILSILCLEKIDLIAH
jgi:hypothetical protein